MQTQTWKLRTTHLMFRLLGTVAPRVAAQRAYTLFTTPQPRRSAGRDQSVMQAARELHATYTKGALVGYSWGEGPNILLVHGWEGVARNFSTMVMPLVDAGFRVIAFDAPAHGKSDGTSSSIVEYASVLSALITEFGPMYGVVAHSAGAASLVLTLGTVKHYRMRRLVLMGAPCEFGDVLARFADQMNLTPRTWEHMQRLTRERMGMPLSAFSVKSIIPYISTPGLVIHDIQDPVIPFSDGETIAAHWPGAQLIATDGLGHNHPLRNPEVIEQIVRFMADPLPDDWHSSFA